MYSVLLERWFILPAFSAVLLILSFHPFNVWPLSFVALVPLYYFVAAFPGRPPHTVFLGGFLAGALFALVLSYFTVIQFQWLPETYIFNSVVRLSFIPIALLGGIFGGGVAMLAYRFLRTSSVLLNSLVGASVYTLSEMLLHILCGGYYFATLAYASASLSPLLALAPIGGTFLVSFFVAWVNSVLAEALVTQTFRKEFITAAAIPLGVFLCLGAWQTWVFAKEDITAKLSVAAIQVASKEEVKYGEQEGKRFSLPELEKTLQSAGQDSPELLIYPFSPVEGVLYVGEKEHLVPDILKAQLQVFAQWVGDTVSPSTTVSVWSNIYEDQLFYNDLLFFRGGELVSRYRKRALFPFIDYTPAWAQKLNFYSTSVDFTAGEEETVQIPGASIGALLCSEIQRQDFARSLSGKVPLIVSAGSEAIFVDELASDFSLKAAQFRAAENNVPVIRSNILGPSAFIARDGSLTVLMKRGEGGVLRGVIEFGVGDPTLFSRFGNLPLATAMISLCAVAWIRKQRYE